VPTYEYTCRECGATFSRREHIAEHGASGPTCPKCNSRDVEQRMSGFFAKTARKS
jgi:putative FmdB family regulatory protein